MIAGTMGHKVDLALPNVTVPADDPRRCQVSRLACAHHVATAARRTRSSGNGTRHGAHVRMLSAGQDWYEQGDIWARIAEHRCTDRDPLPSTPATPLTAAGT